MKLVVDTNVVVSALLWQGVPGRLLDLAGEQQARLFASRARLDELADVLGRAWYRRYCATTSRIQRITSGAAGPGAFRWSESISGMRFSGCGGIAANSWSRNFSSPG